LQAQHRAFPTAEGGGAFTNGGRGGKVYQVTSLADDGSVGTLRYAIAQKGARTVVFRLSGIIDLVSDLKISNDSITIAGQTAPGDGICLRNYTFNISANQVIVRYVRFRMGDLKKNQDDALNGYSSNPKNKNHIILDHCSSSWSIDEALSFYGYDSCTVQWCIASESLDSSYHVKGPHGYGGIEGGFNTNFHHNLYAHHTSRNPRFSGRTPAGSGTVYSYNLDFRNNVIYNWGENSSYGGEESTINIVNNYYKYGPATLSTVKNRIFNPYGAGDSTGQFYLKGNYMDGDTGVTNNNWNGVVAQYTAFRWATAVASDSFAVPAIKNNTPQDAYALVLANAGAKLPKRDTIDSRIVLEVANRTATYKGHTHYYEKAHSLDTSVAHGIIDSQSDVGGWPTYNTAPPPVDSDNDGMPDDWEIAHGLNSNDATDRNKIDTATGYTMLEVYLNTLTGELSSTTTSVAETPSTVPATFSLQQNYPNPFNPSTTIQYGLPNQSLVTVKVYSVLGQEVTTLVNGVETAGMHITTWNGRNSSGIQAASGIYLLRVAAQSMSGSGSFLQVRKMVLLK
jgi:hypothetical protein